MVGSLVFALVAVGGFYMVPETGKGRVPVASSQPALGSGGR
jgi:hypothetical protein